MRDMFGDSIDPGRVRLHRRTWWPFQPLNTVMAPDGHIWFHPRGRLWRDDFAEAPIGLQALLVHELAHVWQHQRGLCLMLRRHPFCRYDYDLKSVKPLARYGIEQQAMIAQDAFVARCAGRADPALEALVDQLSGKK